MFLRWNAAPLASGGSKLPGAKRRADTPLFPPHLFPPLGSTMLFKSAAVPTTGAGVYAPAGLQFTTPKGTVTVLRVLTVFCDNPTALTSILFTVRVNGTAASGLNGLTFIGRAAGSYEKVFDQWSLEIPELATIDVQIQQSDTGSYDAVGMQLEGWQYTPAVLDV